LIVIDRSVAINQQSVNQLINQSVGNQTNQKPPWSELSSASYSVTNQNPVHRPLNHNIKAIIPTARINPAIIGEAKAAKRARRIQSRIAKEERQAQEAAISDNPAVSTLFAASPMATSHT
jgi:hypothetical protein